MRSASKSFIIDEVGIKITLHNEIILQWWSRHQIQWSLHQIHSTLMKLASKSLHRRWHLYLWSQGSKVGNWANLHRGRATPIRSKSWIWWPILIWCNKRRPHNICIWVSNLTLKYYIQQIRYDFSGMNKSHRTHKPIISSQQNDIATSFWHDDVIISCPLVCIFHNPMQMHIQTQDIDQLIRNSQTFFVNILDLIKLFDCVHLNPKCA